MSDDYCIVRAHDEEAAYFIWEQEQFKNEIAKPEDDRTVKSIRGKLYFYRGKVLLMVVVRSAESEKAANEYLTNGVINYQGIVL